MSYGIVGVLALVDVMAKFFKKIVMIIEQATVEG